MAITGVHAVLYTHEAEGDAGGGWLIFALPPAELAVHRHRARAATSSFT
jgi:hypothetical protein